MGDNHANTRMGIGSQVDAGERERETERGVEEKEREREASQVNRTGWQVRSSVVLLWCKCQESFGERSKEEAKA